MLLRSDLCTLTWPSGGAPSAGPQGVQHPTTKIARRLAGPVMLEWPCSALQSGSLDTAVSYRILRAMHSRRSDAL